MKFLSAVLFLCSTTAQWNFAQAQSCESLPSITSACPEIRIVSGGYDSSWQGRILQRIEGPSIISSLHYLYEHDPCYPLYRETTSHPVQLLLVKDEFVWKFVDDDGGVCGERGESLEGTVDYDVFDPSDFTGSMDCAGPNGASCDDFSCIYGTRSKPIKLECLESSIVSRGSSASLTQGVLCGTGLILAITSIFVSI